MINYSIIIPHYNTPDLLERCLKSIPQRKDVQVIVVDDNSPGNECYLTTIGELSRPGIEYYVTTDGKGAGHARNIGLSYAKGKWIIFADSDDFFVENFSVMLNEYIDDSNDLVYFNIRVCDCYDTTKEYCSGKEILFKRYELTGDDMCFRISYTEPWGKLIKHKLLVDNEITFQETRANNDLLFSIKTGVLAKTVRIDKRPLYWYVIRMGSLGHQNKPEPYEKITDRVRAWNSTQLFLNSQKIMTSFYLPVIPCIPLIRRDKIMYFRIISFMKKEKIKYRLVIYDTIKHLITKILRGQGFVKVNDIVYNIKKS